MLQIQSPSKYCPFDALHRSKRVFHFSKQCWYSCKVMPFNASVVFLFTSSTSAKRFPLRTFSFGGIKRSRTERDRVNMAGGEAGSCCFWLKIVSHSRLCALARCRGEATTPHFAVPRSKSVGRNSRTHQTNQQDLRRSSKISSRILAMFSSVREVEGRPERGWSASDNSPFLKRENHS